MPKGLQFDFREIVVFLRAGTRSETGRRYFAYKEK